VNVIPRSEQYRYSWLLMNSYLLSESRPSRGNGSDRSTSCSAAKHHCWALLRRARTSVHPVFTQVTGEGLAEVPEGVAALVGHQIDLAEPRGGLAPLGEGPDGDLALQQGPRLGPGAASHPQAPALRDEHPVDRGRGHRQELVPDLARDLELPGPLQDLDDLGQERSEALAGRAT
jgi:hypothetical protein